MSEISIQVRRVTEKVKQYYSIFGLRPYSRMAPGRSVIRGSKRLGFDEIECVVAETARGTSVGFYSINQLQGLIHAIPFIFVLLLSGLAQIPALNPYLTGTADNFIKVNFVALFTGSSTFDFNFIVVILLIGVLFVASELMTQRIRLDIVKSRFSFYSREGLWDTKEIPLSLIVLQAIRSPFMHLWLLAVIYYAVFASTGAVIPDLIQLYNSKQAALLNATTDAFLITSGLVLGLLASYKAIKLRKAYGRYDDRTRITGGLTERRVDPILFGIQAALFAGVVSTIFLAVTFMSGATATQLGQFLFFTIIGGAIAGSIHEEGNAWMFATYAIFIFFTSLLLIFRTGSQPAYAYIVVLQIFFIPIPFVMLLSTNFDQVLRKDGVNNPDWLFDSLPLMSFITLILNRRKKASVRRAYEQSLEEEVSTEVLDRHIKIQKEILQDPSSNAYKMVRHYFELMFTYTASFEESQFVTLPTFYQFNQWWSSRTGKKMDDNQEKFVEYTDQLLWDPDFLPNDQELTSRESTGRNMVLAIQ